MIFPVYQMLGFQACTTVPGLGSGLKAETVLVQQITQFLQPAGPLQLFRQFMKPSCRSILVGKCSLFPEDGKQMAVLSDRGSPESY